MAKSKSKGGGFSARTANAGEGGGIAGALAQMTEVECVDNFTYGGRQKGHPQAAVRVVYEIDGFDKPWEQHYTFGKANRYEVRDDGDSITSEGQLNRNCAAYAFFDAIEEAAEAAGLDIEDLLPEEDGVITVAPLRERWVRLHNIKFTPVDGDPKDLPVPASFEEDGPAAPKAGKSGSKKSGGKNIETKTEEAIVALLDGDPIRDRDVPNALFRANRKDPDVKAMMQQAFKKTWITDEDRPWTVNKKGVLEAAEPDDDDAED